MGDEMTMEKRLRKYVERMKACSPLERVRIVREISGFKKEAMPFLEALLKDEDRNLRRWAMHILWKIGDVAAVPALIDMLWADWDFDEWECYGDYGIDYFSFIIKLEDALWDLGTPAARALIEIIKDLEEGQGMEDAIEELLKKDRLSLRAMAIVLRDKMSAQEEDWGMPGSPSVKEELLFLVETTRRKGFPDCSTRVLVDWELGKTDIVSASATLAQWFGNEEMSNQAIWAFRQMGDAAVDPLIKILTGTEDQKVGESAAEALAGIGEASLPALIEALEKASGERVLENIVYALAIIGSPAVRTLVERTRDSNKVVRMRAAWALGELKDKDATPVLLGMAKDAAEAGHIRWQALISIGLIGDGSAAPTLSELLKDENPGVRSLAASALGRTGDHQAAPVLFGVLNSKGEESDTRKQAGEAIKLILEKEMERADLS